ncbi:hypothetical protein RJ639_005721, partial [Escallonia herrerae]
YCDGVHSIIDGSGLNHSVAGESSKFSVFLRDAYQYPSPVELEKLQVQILQVSDLRQVWPSIRPVDLLQFLLLQRHESMKQSGGEVRTSAYDVVYTPEKSGTYEIRVSCGNIPLNAGQPFRKEVSAGEVNASLSRVVDYAPRVPKLIKNEIVVELRDSFSNPVMFQQSNLKLDISSINKSEFSTWGFVDNKNGSYTGSYRVKDVGTYEICASLSGKHVLPCPFGVNVYSSEHFPKAYNDAVSVWEDESISFNSLQNDYFAGNASVVIAELSKPVHGSLLQYGHDFRYTPYKGFYGNDSFTYTISDVNGNLASAAVNISILLTPPQFVSFPSQLLATEDALSPRFGSGFSSFEITYSDLVENISVTLSARSGTVCLSPMLMQFWMPVWSALCVSTGNEKARHLALAGPLEVINFALQSIQYLGDENFCGNDTIRVSTMNKNGRNDLDVPIFVEPVNDPPFINVPEFIILEEKRGEAGTLIFNRQRDKFDFCIGDPDLLCFPGNKSHFLVMFSVEVNSGFLSTNLPAELISTTELKLKNSYQWQPLQTFVTISKHFMVKAKGVRFWGTVNDCNSVMQQLSYYGGEHGSILTIEVNDMGRYGCYPDCAELMSVPIFVEATVNLIRRRPMSSLVAHTLGTAIVIEFIFLFSLGVLLLFFMCKCAMVLIHEKRRCVRQGQDIELSRIQHSNQQTAFTLAAVKSCRRQVRPITMATTTAAYQKLLGVGTKIVAVGRNYAAHAKELGNAVPKEPVLFMKPTTSYLANGGTIEVPQPLESLDHEVELAVVIGRKARDVAEATAMDYVGGGYALALDMTAREIQSTAKSAGLPWTVAKGQDTFTPISSVLPQSMVPDPHNLELWLKVDGKTRQQGSTGDMMFKIPFLISHISSIMTLLEGDVILTGTPQGVGPVKVGQRIDAGITGLLDVHFDVGKRERPKRS